MKALALALILIAPLAQAETTLSAVGALSNDLGYERTGFGIQIDNRQRLGDWGWSVQGMALSHAKVTGKGQRYQAIGMARRFHGHHYGTLGPIVRFGTNATEDQIAAAEAYYTTETGL